MNGGLVAFGLAVLAAYGAFMLYTAMVFGWDGLGPSRRVRRGTVRARARRLLDDASLDGMRLTEFVGVEVVVAMVAGLVAWAIYGGVAVPIVAGLVATPVPIVAGRARRRGRIERARDAWPRMIEEIRIQVTNLGRSIPQALLEVGSRGPEELRPPFAEARREWMMSTDFDRTVAVLTSRLADPTADTVCETLLVAHELGGSEVDTRLRALVEDRLQDAQGRKDARAKQAGVRFARVFVLLVPVGMALVGLSIGDGRAAFEAPSGQVAVLVAFVLMGGCWLWASQLLRLPTEVRVFGSDDASA